MEGREQSGNFRNSQKSIRTYRNNHLVLEGERSSQRKRKGEYVKMKI